MTDTIISTSQSFGHGLESSGDDLIVTRTGAINVLGGSAITGFSFNSGHQVTINGEVSTTTYDALFVQSTDTRITIGATGTVTAEDNIGGYRVIFLNGANAVLTNHGAILSSSLTGVTVNAINAVIHNTGLISGYREGIFDVLGATISNSGQIVSTAFDGFGGAAVRMGGGGWLTNTGDITGGGTTHALFIAGVCSIMNGGTISAGRTTTLEAVDATILSLVNTGRILAGPDLFAVRTGAGADSIVNSGQVVGHVYLGGNDDLLDTRGGNVVGDVFGGAGNDVYMVDGPGITILENADEGLDRIESRANFDLSTVANVENLTLLDAALLGTGNDLANTLTGNLANNRLNGAAGNDTLNGADGDDLLRGGAGRDSLVGGDGDDTLRGGTGNDRLTGGDEADTFQYRTFDDSGTSNGTRDIIADFTSGLDTIDLSRLDANSVAAGNQAFAFIGAGAFSNVAGQVRFATVSGKPMLEADVNGDGTADFQIELSGVSTLNLADLIL